MARFNPVKLPDLVLSHEHDRPNIDLRETAQRPAEREKRPPSVFFRGSLTGHDLMALFPPPSPCAGFLRSPTSDFFRQQERDYFARKGKEIVPVPHDVDADVDVHDRAVPRSEPDEVNPSALIVHRWSPNQELRQARFTRDAGLNKCDARVAFAVSSKSSIPHEPPHPVNTATRVAGPPDIIDTKRSALRRRNHDSPDQASLTYKKIIILEEPPREPAKEVSASSVYEELRRRQRRRRQRRGQCVPLSEQIAVIS